MIYQWKPGTRINADAEAVAVELQALGDNITPAMVVQAASKKRSALHSCFTWDDTEAARQYRLQEARLILRSIVVTEEPKEEAAPPRVIRAYENVTVGENRAYVPIDAVLQDETMRDEVFGEIASGIDELREKLASYLARAGISFTDKRKAEQAKQRLKSARDLLSA